MILTMHTEKWKKKYVNINRFVECSNHLICFTILIFYIPPHMIFPFFYIFTLNDFITKYDYLHHY